ncbi:hypothetical protein [Methylobacterium brachiatum]|uniref:hypothetical protein n=1 Tax=Methylobacterium brachiatum TaxID=269660 RepID=UPI00244CEA5E|nr:hypothetical protein [Methylobacterium brachiatum]MDH2313373.1 hypothetical protein [Methylobacterium brachiatum]
MTRIRIGYMITPSPLTEPMEPKMLNAPADLVLTLIAVGSALIAFGVPAVGMSLGWGR